MKRLQVLMGGLAVGVLLFTTGCAALSSYTSGPVKTQIVTFPIETFVELDGKVIGSSPLLITLPQDEHGKLNGHANIRLIPKPKADQTLYSPKAKEFCPTDYPLKVPVRVMIDMRSDLVNATSATNAELPELKLY